tara:strand:- start:2225 stop:2446 length:222 start_codon:yes stop_codon:yes gene_type:complete
MQHNFETIKRKIQRGGQVMPAEVVLCLRELLLKFDEITEKLNGLEKSIESGQGSNPVSKRKVSKSKVQINSDK